MFVLQGLIKPGNEVHNMPEITSTYEPLVLVDTADLPEDEWNTAAEVSAEVMQPLF